MEDETRTWEIRVGVHTTEDQVCELVERIQGLLCPDPDHAPPCPVPWSTGLVETDDYPELRQQFEIEHASRTP